MRMIFLILACLLAPSWVSGEKILSATGVSLEDMPTDVPNHPNPKPLLVAKPTEPMRRNASPVQEVSQTEKEAKVEDPAMKPMQVTGFITANGSIYEVEDKNGMGQIEARQNGELLTPQPGEFICNYGSVVLYSDMPCEQVAEAQKPVAMEVKKQKETMEKPVKTMNKEKETSALDIQADDNADSVEHKEIDNDMDASVANAANRKKTKKPVRKSGNKKKTNKKQSNRRNPNNPQYVVRRTVYKIKNPQGQQISQQQQQQQQQLQQPLQQALQQAVAQRQQQQQQLQKPQNQNQRRPQTANNRRRQQQQIRRILQLEQQRRRRLQQQNPANLEKRNKQRYLSPDGILYEIIHVNEN